MVDEAKFFVKTRLPAIKVFIEELPAVLRQELTLVIETGAGLYHLAQ